MFTYIFENWSGKKMHYSRRDLTDERVPTETVLLIDTEVVQ